MSTQRQRWRASPSESACPSSTGMSRGCWRGGSALRSRLTALRFEKRIREAAATMLVEGAAGDSNQALMGAGATVCRPRGPLCGECPVAGDCEGFRLGVPESLPGQAGAAGAGAAATAVGLGRRGWGPVALPPFSGRGVGWRESGSCPPWVWRKQVSPDSRAGTEGGSSRRKAWLVSPRHHLPRRDGRAGARAMARAKGEKWRPGGEVVRA